MINNTLSVTFTLKGAVRQLRTVDTLKKPAVFTLSYRNQKDEKIRVSNKVVKTNHQVKNEEHQALKVLDIPLNAFLSFPSYSAINEARRRNILDWDKIPRKAMIKKWNLLPLDQKILIHMDDYVNDLEAVSASW